MDESDEKLISNHNECFYNPTAFECDDRLCTSGLWSCGDGQCIPGFNVFGYQTRLPQKNFCMSLRELNHMCEASARWRLWTIANSGLCTNKIGYDDPNLSMEQTALSIFHQCIYLIRCALSQGFERDCVCDHTNCSIILNERCTQQNMYPYPNGSLVRPYMYSLYSFNRSWVDHTPDRFQWYGAIKCRGYQGFIDASDDHWEDFDVSWATSPFLTLDEIFCRISKMNLTSTVQFDLWCWNNSQTFTNRPYAVDPNMCPDSHKCLSQYRIRDGNYDCLDGGDEYYPNTGRYPCRNQQKYRLRCSADEESCLPVTKFTSIFPSCSNGFDLFAYGNGQPLSHILCWYRNDDGCRFMRDYIRNVSVLNRTSPEQDVQPVGRIRFRAYCDSFWTLKSHLDEHPDFCRQWTCRHDQYQCQTGQCIDINWVCDGEWDCSDASDEEALVMIKEWSVHNRQIPVLSKLIEQCKERSTKQAFVDFCDVSREFPCFRANVTQPFDIVQNRPCISLTQLGNGHADCYDWQDERNTFIDCNNHMFGLTTISLDGQCMGPDLACTDFMPDWKVNPFCFYRSKNASCLNVDDVDCLDGSCRKNARCNDRRECTHGEDEYRCPPFPRQRESHAYRFFKEQFNPLTQKLNWKAASTLVKQHPIDDASSSSSRSMKALDEKYAFMCNRGVAVHIGHNRTVCFCSSMYYGSKCQYYNDRLSIITHLNLSGLPQKMAYPYFRILATFLYKEKIIDSYQCVLNTTLEYRNHTKHRFVFSYLRSKTMLEQRKERYFNRTDIITNHPYSVRFQVFGMRQNVTTELNGIWLYPIYFDFLPSFRLATVLKFPHWYSNASYEPCQTVTCNANSTCRVLINRKEAFCECKHGFYGDKCQFYAAECSTFCSVDSICKVVFEIMPTRRVRLQCICPLNRFGPGCHLYHDECKSNPCLHNGTCQQTYHPYNQQPFICLCTKQFYGHRCEKEKEIIRLHPNISDTPLASVVQFCNIHTLSHEIFIQHQQAFHGLPSIIQYRYHIAQAPSLIMFKIYNNGRDPSYYLFYAHPLLNGTMSNLTLRARSCPPATRLLNPSKLTRTRVSFLLKLF